jgi:hypothetical protein
MLLSFTYNEIWCNYANGVATIDNYFKICQKKKIRNDDNVGQYVPLFEATQALPKPDF